MCHCDSNEKRFCLAYYSASDSFRSCIVERFFSYPKLIFESVMFLESRCCFKCNVIELNETLVETFPAWDA